MKTNSEKLKEQIENQRQRRTESKYCWRCCGTKIFERSADGTWVCLVCGTQK